MSTADNMMPPQAVPIDRTPAGEQAFISDAGVDALVDQVVFAKDRDTLVAATHALDRVLLANQFVVPSYTRRAEPIAHWDRFGHPDHIPDYNIGFPQVWWFDKDKAAKTGGTQ